ncbi:hypothetical protein ANN_19356 [Periplaneta americana]|uniref:DUF4371 domain-containing protein n=1 Tax=Periplaneta americana TaxID=6978 RepID=A0ABQ8S9U9_PERAM|nr:hypothetical protein ANN_19356 [Periplaneta americana]
MAGLCEGGNEPSGPLIANCKEELLAEIEEAEFVSVLADETTDISKRFQLVIVVRYCNKEGKAAEKFWGFFNPTKMQMQYQSAYFHS